jgi:nicotinamidase-related amidase
MAHTALVVVDMLNSYQHPDAEALTRGVSEIIDPLAKLISHASRRDDIELIYVNDNYGDFTADRDGLIHAALHGARPDLVEPIVPSGDTRFITKVRHSAFYCTPLDYLLGRLGIERLVLTGQVTEQCILYSALDAYVRHLSVLVPPEAVAPIDPELGSAALAMMQRNMRAQIAPAAHCLDPAS